MSNQEERGRLHAEMAKMQSLEEEALLKGALATQAGKARSTKGGAARRGETANGNNDQGGQEGPQTDGDETDGYSDQVLRAPCVSRSFHLSIHPDPRSRTPGFPKQNLSQEP